MRRTGPATVNLITSSSDGSKLIAATSNGVYKSVDYGVTWVLSFNSSLNFYNVASSEDGRKLIAQTYYYNDSGSGIYLSSDYGVSWEQLTVPFFSYYSYIDKSVSISGDGTRLFLTSYLDGLYLSEDSGVTWLQNLVSKDIYPYKTYVSSDGANIQIIAGDYYWGEKVLIKMKNNNGGVKGGSMDSLTLVYLANGTWGVKNKLGSNFSNY